MEPKYILEKQLQSLDIKKARILDDLNVTELLNQHEIIVNRGNSQVCLEAVYMKKKLLIYPMGIKTIFDDCSNILLHQSELNEKLSLLNTEHYLDQMQKIKSDHIPYTGKTALKNIAGFIMNSRQLHIRDEKKALHLSLLYYICRKTDRAIALTRYFSKAEADSICQFYQKPYSPKRFVEVMLMFKTDLLIKFYLTKIYIDHLARTRCFRRFFICDLKWIDLPDKEFVPYFWADTHKNFAKSYKSLNKETN